MLRLNPTTLYQYIWKLIISIAVWQVRQGANGGGGGAVWVGMVPGEGLGVGVGVVVGV